MPSNVPVVMVVECSFLEQYDLHIMYICMYSHEFVYRHG